MANHGAPALILIASLLMAVALSGADARLTAVLHHNAAAAVRGAKAITVRRDANGGYVVEKAAPAAFQELACNKVVGVQKGETCSSVADGAGLSEDQFLAFNPNINCATLFVGQWVCLLAQGA